MDTLLSALNPAQREAVTLAQGHGLILAGAGSGKTRVLVHRLGWLMDQGIPPQAILTVTFTNKAAHELKSRIEQQFQLPTQGLWVGTFHGIAHRMLRTHADRLGLPSGFQILDTDDQARLIKRIFQSLQIEDERLTPKSVLHEIQHHKEEGRRAHALPHPQN
jgi:DNA helicase-2/ATP-dependent DNA helicase PcrA